MIYIELYFRFFLTGLFSIGGGLATLPFLYEMAGATGWFTTADIANMIAVSESTPGALGINMSTYAGYVTAGIPGGILATLGLATPSVIIILIIARILKKFRDNPYVEKAFYGLRAASIALISAAGINVAKTVLVDLDLFAETGLLTDLITWKAWILAIAIYLVSKKWNWHPIALIAMAAAVGIVFQF